MLLVSVEIIDMLLFVDQFGAVAIPGEISVPDLLIFSSILTTVSTLLQYLLLRLKILRKFCV